MRVLLAVVALLCATAFTSAAVIPVVAQLYGSSFNPASGSPNSGLLIGLYDNTANLFNFYAVHNISGPVTATFQVGNTTVKNGPVLFTVAGNQGMFINSTWSNTAASAFNILNNNVYLNISSSAYPMGDITGVITTTGFTHLAMLDFGQTNQSSASPVTSKGVAVLTLNDANLLGTVVSHSVPNNTVTAAHIHGTATYCQSAGILYPYSSPYTQIVQNFQYDNTSVAQLNNQTHYINVHSTNWPNGEVRGQIVPATYFSSNNINSIQAGACANSGATPTPTPTPTSNSTATPTTSGSTTASPSGSSTTASPSPAGPTTTSTASPTGSTSASPTSTPKPSGAPTLSVSLIAIAAVVIALL